MEDCTPVSAFASAPRALGDLPSARLRVSEIVIDEFAGHFGGAEVPTHDLVALRRLALMSGAEMAKEAGSTRPQLVALLASLRDDDLDPVHDRIFSASEMDWFADERLKGIYRALLSWMLEGVEPVSQRG